MHIEKLGVLISEADSDLAAFSYCVDRYGYAKRTVNCRMAKGLWRTKNIKLHREVLARIVGREVNSKDICDHINRNRLDNRRENLRVVSLAGNHQNRGPNAGGSSSYRGVTWVKKRKKWQSQVGHKGKRYYCGYFGSEHDAAEAAKAKRKELGFLGECDE